MSNVEVDKLSTDDLEVVPGVGYLVAPADLPTAYEEEDTLPITPTIDTTQKDLEQREVAYTSLSQRTDRDVVLSGPIIGGWGPGRYFQNRGRAHDFMVAKYGAGRVVELDGKTRGRWSFLIKDLRAGASRLKGAKDAS